MLFSPLKWPRAILLVDMNAFFASIEQRERPELRGRPIAVINGNQGSCIITCSYEARAYGIKTGMRLQEARKRCPELIPCSARPKLYSQISDEVISALEKITPDIEVFSVDEAFLDVTRCQNLFGTPARMAHMAQSAIYQATELPCSIGVSGDKTTAKYAAKLLKPNGITIIPPWESANRLRSVRVTELCGIGDGIGRFLASRGVVYCGDMAQLPISVLAKRFGNLGRRIWTMCQGLDPDPVFQRDRAPLSVGHGKVMPPNTNNRVTILTYLLHMSEKVAARLRKYDLWCQEYFIGIRTHADCISEQYQHVAPTNDGKVIFDLCKNFIHTSWQGQAIQHVQVTALNPTPIHSQQDLFYRHDPKRAALNQITDCINHRYGAFCLAPATLLHRSSSPNVIAFNHRP